MDMIELYVLHFYTSSKFFLDLFVTLKSIFPNCILSIVMMINFKETVKFIYSSLYKV
jgi:hypothetical protein